MNDRISQNAADKRPWREASPTILAKVTLGSALTRATQHRPRVVPAGASPGSGWLHHRHRERLARPQATTSRRAPASAARRLPVDRRRSRAATKRGRPGAAGPRRRPRHLPTSRAAAAASPRRLPSSAAASTPLSPKVAGLRFQAAGRAAGVTRPPWAAGVNPPETLLERSRRTAVVAPTSPSWSSPPSARRWRPSGSPTPGRGPHEAVSGVRELSPDLRSASHAAGGRNG